MGPSVRDGSSMAEPASGRMERFEQRQSQHLPTDGDASHQLNQQFDRYRSSDDAQQIYPKQTAMQYGSPYKHGTSPSQNLGWQNTPDAHQNASAAQHIQPGSSPSQHWQRPGSVSHSSSPVPQQYGSPDSHYSAAFFDSTRPGMDREAFIAGERAAITRSLQMMLPSQQQLGALGSGLQRLEYMVSEESSRARHMQSATVELSTIARNLTDRLDRLEKIQLPAMEGRVQQALDAPLAQEFKATLSSLTIAMEQSRKQHYYNAHPTLTGFLLQRLGSIGSAAVLYTQKALSNADVAALFLSRKILLDEKARPEAGDYEEELSHQQPGKSDSREKIERILKSVGGGALFLTAVEVSWQLHNRWINMLPRTLRRAVFPARMGLKILRIATWVASILITTVVSRRGCYVLAESGVIKLKQFCQWCLAFRILRGPKAALPEAGEQEEADEEMAQIHDQDGQEDIASDEMKTRMPYSDVVRLQATTDHDGVVDSNVPLPRVRSIFDTPPPSPQ